jgi:predicted hotdog family 3-hydroxylacyl-ACP dehydratase
MSLAFPVPTSLLSAYLPHRAPFVWVNDVISISTGADGPSGICRVKFSGDSAFLGGKGKPRVSSVVEWIAQAYGFVKACHHLEGGGGEPPAERAFLVGISDCEVDLSALGEECSVLVEVFERRVLHPAYLLEGVVKSEHDCRVFGRASLKVFSG